MGFLCSPSTLWLLSELRTLLPEFPCNYQHMVTQEARACHSLIITDSEWHLPPGQSETSFLSSVNRWPQDGGKHCYYSKYLTENVGCQKLFYPPEELNERSQIIQWGFGAFEPYITGTSGQTLWKMLVTFDICWMKVIYLLKGFFTKKVNNESVTQYCL